MFSKKLAIDLGTTFTRIQLPKNGVVIDEPSVVAEYPDRKTLAAVGREALEMIERTPESLDAGYPLHSGVVADFKKARHLLEHLMNKALGRYRIRQPIAMLTVSSGATSTERRAVIEVAKSAGIKEPHLIEAPVAAAIGAGVPVADPTGNLIVHIGSGVTEVAVISLSGVISQKTIRVAGNTIDEAIAKYLRNTHNIYIGSQTANEAKHLVGSAMPVDKDEVMSVQGRDSTGGMPKEIEITTNELVPAIEEVLEKIVITIRSVIEKTQPELVADIVEHGLILSGGTANLKNLDQLLRKVVGVPVTIAQDPQLCPIKGAYLTLANLSDYKQSLFISDL